MSDRAEYWEKLVRAWEQSGLSQVEFCRRRRVKAGTLAWWKHRLKGAGDQVGRKTMRRVVRRKQPRHADFVEVGVPHAALAISSAAAPVAGGGHCGYEIVLPSGRVIRLPRDFDPSIVARLIATVESF